VQKTRVIGCARRVLVHRLRSPHSAICAWVKTRPNRGVVAWLADADEDRVFISVVTLAELRYGIERMGASTCRKRLDKWLRGDLPARFEGRVLSIDGIIADGWGKVVARSEAVGRPISAMDAFIAATAEAHGVTLVTRNTSDFEASLKHVINPWTDDEGQAP
jgi:predicted nucleic acid-binding protein